jgi:hypothetical protein
MPPVKCEQCGKESGGEHGPKIHGGREHAGKAKAKRGRGKAGAGGACTICGRSFTVAMHLARQVAAAHAGLDVSKLTVALCEMGLGTAGPWHSHFP